MPSNKFTNHGATNRRPKVCKSPPLQPRLPPVPSTCNVSPATLNVPTGGTGVLVTQFCNVGTPAASSVTANPTATGGSFTVDAMAENCGPTDGQITWTAPGTSGVHSGTIEQIDQRGNSCSQPVTLKAWPAAAVCANLSPAPDEWEVTVSGLTNGTCNFCSIYNGTHKMAYVGSCTWRKTFSVNGPCNPMLPGQCSFFVNPTDTALSFRAAGAALTVAYTGPAAANFYDPITLTKITTDATCIGWPATIVVSPVP